ncbi:MAG: cation:proton antiporter [Elainellaceae cyanobacterium]
MDEFNLTLTAIGGSVLLLGLVSDYFRHNWWTSDPLTAMLLGIVLGSVVLNWINPNEWGLSKEHVLEQAARLTMAIGLMGVALRLPQKYFLRNWRGLAVLLGLVMPLMWGVSGSAHLRCFEDSGLGSDDDRSSRNFDRSDCRDFNRDGNRR